MHYLLKGVLSCTLLFCLFFISCNFKPIHYPYAENNTTVNEYYGVRVADDYEWLEANKEFSPVKSKWIHAQSELCNAYFSDRDTAVRQRIEDLASVPHYRFIDFVNDTLYYYRALPYSNKLNLYKYIEETANSKFVSSITFPFTLTDKSIVRLSPDLSMLACIGKVKGAFNSIYIYDLRSGDAQPLHIIRGVAEFPFYWNESEIIYMEDPMYHDSEDLSINKVLMFNTLRAEYTTLFEDSIDEIATLIDFNFDQKSNALYLGKYSLNEEQVFQLQKICMKRRNSELLLEIPMRDNVSYRIGGVDNKHAYIIGVDGQRRGELLGYNIEDNEIDTLIERHWMPMAGFSQMRDHVIGYFQDFNANRAYVVNKETRERREIPMNDDKFYTFLINKNDTTIFYQEETLVSPRHLYKLNPSELDKPKLLANVQDLPFRSDDYVVEYKTLTREDGSVVNLAVSYKRGLKKDGTNPVFLLSFINAENSYLDQFNFSRILYMDYGYVFVQRRFADSQKTLSLKERVDDLDLVVNTLIDEDYSSPDKIAVLGREYGAAAVMSLMNKNPELKIHTILLDGLFDMVRYQQAGKLLYQNNRLFKVDTAEEFITLLNESPYHNVKHRESYPPVLMMVSLENLNIPPVHTYKMTALMQMRTKGVNPIILFAPSSGKDTDYVYDFKDYIEHAFCFLMKNMDVAMIN